MYYAIEFYFCSFTFGWLIGEFISGLPYIRPIPKITAVAGEVLKLKCPVSGYPIEQISWEKGTYILWCGE